MLSEVQKNLVAEINTEISSLKESVFSSSRMTLEMEGQLRSIIRQQGELLESIRFSAADVGVMLLIQVQMGRIQELNDFCSSLRLKEGVALRMLPTQLMYFPDSS